MVNTPVAIAIVESCGISVSSTLLISPVILVIMGFITIQICKKA